MQVRMWRQVDVAVWKDVSNVGLFQLGRYGFDKVQGKIKDC
jgi:hypothetical protein